MDHEKTALLSVLRHRAELRAEARKAQFSFTPLGRALAAAAVAFLLASCVLPFSTYPLGIALLCAASAHIFPISVGLLAAAFILPTSPWLTVAVVAETLAIRIAARVFVDLPVRIGGDGRRGELWEHLRGKLFCEGLYLRMASACVAVFTLSLFAIIRGGFRYYDLFGAIFSMVTAPIAVFLFCGLFEGEYERLFEARASTRLVALSEAILGAALGFALSAHQSGAFLTVAFGFLSALILLRRRGLLAASLVGGACGLVAGLPFSLILLCAVFVAFSLRGTDSALAASLSCIAGSVCGVLLLGGSSVGTVFLPLFCGTAVYCLGERLVSLHVKTAPADCVAGESDKQEKRAERMATALVELSDVFTTMSERQSASPRGMHGEKAALLARDYRLSAALLRELSVPRSSNCQAPTVRVSYGSGFSAKEGVCGDVISIFRDEENGFFYAAINDGMGTGEEAAFTAQLGSLFLRKLLPTGISPETALRMLNHFLRFGRNTDGIESSTTVDLFALNVASGHAVLFKSGAAPTYVKRGKNVFYLDSKTAPIGILGEIDAGQINFDVRSGDLLVMVSDGVTDGDAEREWLLKLMETADPSDDPNLLAQTLLGIAGEENRPDDLSAIVLCIE